MMIQAKLAWLAFKNMLRTAARDPFWAIGALVTGPFRAGRYMLQIAVVFFLVILAVGFSLQYVMSTLSAVYGSPLWVVGNWLFRIFVLLFLFRLMTGPMIEHFGDAVGDTHGSARFATNKEMLPLLRQMPAC